MEPKDLFKKGCRPDKLDFRDFRAEIALKAIPLPEEFSVSNRISWIKNQGSSGSCVAQAISYYAEVLNQRETGKDTKLSARDIYSLIHAPGGGAGIRDACNKLIKSGIIPEEKAPSYLNGQPPGEPFMRQRNDITPEEVEEGNIYLAKSYVRVPTTSLEAIKQAIYQGSGCVSGILGGSGTFSQTIAKPIFPIVWGHSLFLTGWRKINGKEFIQFCNSWGTEFGERGFGYFGEDCIKAGIIFNPWTIMDFPNSYYQKLKEQASLLTKLVLLYRQLIELLKKK